MTVMNTLYPVEKTVMSAHHHQVFLHSEEGLMARIPPLWGHSDSMGGAMQLY